MRRLWHGEDEAVKQYDDMKREEDEFKVLEILQLLAERSILS